MGAIVCALGASLAHAQAADGPAGAATQLASDALPGVERVPLPVAPLEGPALVVGSAYGFTEAIAPDDRGHHQGELGVAAAVSPLAGLGIGVQIEGQLDNNSDGYGFMASTRLQLRYVFAPGAPDGLASATGLRLGVQAAADLPAATEPGNALAAVGGRGAALIGYRGTDWQLGAQVGAALDRGAEALESDERLTQADRVSLEISEPAQLLFGVAGAVNALGLTWIGEWSWDPALGGDAPAPLEAPMWLRLGARVPLGSRLALTALAGLSPSSRPAFSADDALRRIEPRVWLGVRVAASLAAGAPRDARSGFGELVGRVRSPGGRPVAGAVIRAGGRTVRSRADGRFALSPLPLGEHAVTVSARGFADTQVSARVHSGRALPLQVVIAPRPVRIHGRITDAQHVPIAGARVGIVRDGEGEYVDTDEDGRFELAEQPVGRAVLSVEAEGFSSAERPLVIAAGDQSALRVSLARDLPAGQIRGTVRAFDGPPLRARIVVRRLEGGARAPAPAPRSGRFQTTADAEGRFAVDVPPGDYTVEVHARGYVSQTRRAQVEERGVTVLIVDLRRGS